MCTQCSPEAGFVGNICQNKLSSGPELNCVIVVVTKLKITDIYQMNIVPCHASFL